MKSNENHHHPHSTLNIFIIILVGVNLLLLSFFPLILLNKINEITNFLITNDTNQPTKPAKINISKATEKLTEETKIDEN